jgi:hypothetical protein
MPYIERDGKCFYLDLATLKETEFHFRGIGSIEKPSLSLNSETIRFNGQLDCTTPQKGLTSLLAIRLYSLYK